MSPDRRHISDFEFNNLRFLGGQIAKVYPEYVDLGKLDPGICIALFWMRNREKWKTMTKEDVKKEKLFYIGQVLRMPLFSEVSILSMMLGDKTEQNFDTRKEYAAE